MDTQKNRLFNNVWDAVFFNIFALFLPLGCTFALLFVNDKTLYLTLFVTVFGVSYNFIMLFGSENISKRLWKEVIIVIVYLIPTIIICFINTIINMQKSGKIVYGIVDVITCLCIAVIPCCIFLYEGVLVIKDDYYMRVKPNCNNKNKNSSLTKGGKKV